MRHEPIVTITLAEYDDLRKSIVEAHKLIAGNTTILRYHYTGTHTGYFIAEKETVIVELMNEIEQLKSQLKSKKSKRWW